VHGPLPGAAAAKPRPPHRPGGTLHPSPCPGPGHRLPHHGL